MSRHDVSWKKRNAVARASRGSLRCLAVGTKRKPLVAKLAGQPLGLGNEGGLLVETDKHRGLPGPELLPIGGRKQKAKGDRRHSARAERRRAVGDDPHARTPSLLY